jgi:plastocyanin
MGHPAVVAAISGVRFVLGLLDSSRVTLAVVFGIPMAIGVVVALGVRRTTPLVVLLAGSLVVAGIALLAAWAVFQPAGHKAAGATASSPIGGGGPGGQPVGQPVSYSCTPSGTRVGEVAKGIAFEKNCLAAPADQPFTIEFDNQDPGTPHNIHIYSADLAKDPNARSLFAGEPVTGPDKATYHVPALAAGKYFFHCDIHPTQMMGGFVVGQS